jgi:hypothetical protein
MSISLKIAALALGAASLFAAGQANAAYCDGTPHPAPSRWAPHSTTTVQCYYLPTVSNGRVTGLQKEVSFHRSYNGPYGGGGSSRWGRPH